ncbi:MAG TPA: CUAEP/CCAEP-tail radical SAM protein [Ktedonobacterales bacterium]|nr:CUAEP/CCAEP-tail radical SAM protein [Ktedonobacterales bacterium]
MRTPGAILLISCYELGHQPLNLASPLAVLKQAGFAPVAIDTAVEPLMDDSITQARLVCVSVPMHTALRLAMRVAERVRTLNPAARLCFYGLYASLNADYLHQQGIEFVIGGEYEQALLALVQTLEQGNHATLPGIGTQSQPAAPILRRLPFIQPDRQMLPPLQRYARLQQGDEFALVGYVETSRGCLHTCLHCPITPVYGGRFFILPREVVLQDIRAQVQMGAQHITFGDPDFLNGPGHSLNILRAMHAEFPALTFDATIKIEHILEHRERFTEFKALGCAFIVSAVEAVSDHVLSHLDKGHTRADVIEALAILADAGIPMRPSLLPFTPWTTLDDYLNLLAFVEQQHLIGQIDPVHYSIRLLLPPGSALLEQPAMRPHLGDLDAAAFTYQWTHPDPRMDQLQRDIAALVEADERANAPAEETFYAIKALAEEAAGLVLSAAHSSRPSSIQKATPHLTESWFC